MSTVIKMKVMPSYKNENVSVNLNRDQVNKIIFTQDFYQEMTNSFYKWNIKESSSAQRMRRHGDGYLLDGSQPTSPSFSYHQTTIVPKQTILESQCQNFTKILIDTQNLTYVSMGGKYKFT